MEVDGDVEPLAAQSSGDGQVVTDAPQSAPMRNYDDLVEMRVTPDDRRSRRLDNVGEVGAGVVAPQGRDQRSGEDHVTDQPQPDQKDFHCWDVPACRRPELPAGHGSIVASSMSMTGMSSLMGYTRLH